MKDRRRLRDGRCVGREGNVHWWLKGESQHRDTTDEARQMKNHTGNEEMVMQLWWFNTVEIKILMSCDEST